MATPFQTDEGATPGQGIQLNGNALQMFSTLINMGFEDKMSIRAANKYPNNAEQAIEWITTQISTPQQPQPPQPPPTTVKPSAYVTAPGFSTSHNPAPSAPRQSTASRSSVNSSTIDSWVTQNNLGSMVLSALKQNGVDSLDDLRLLSTEQEMNEFANDLGLKIMQRKKFVNAVKALVKENQASAPQSTQNQKYQPPHHRQQAYNPYANSQPSMVQQQPQQNPYNQYNANNKYQSQYGQQQPPQSTNMASLSGMNRFKQFGHNDQNNRNYNQGGYNYNNNQRGYNNNSNNQGGYNDYYGNKNNYNPYQKPPSPPKPQNNRFPSSQKQQRSNQNNDDEKKKPKETPEEKRRRLRKEKTAHLTGDVRVSYSLNKRGLHASKKNRCILVIGATGTGKTTCLNSMMNYLWEVEFEDKFRYKLIFDDKHANQAKSQTKDVTAYYLNPPRLKYSLTVVDTPGISLSNLLCDETLYAILHIIYRIW